jgi:hypothetical protein
VHLHWGPRPNAVELIEYKKEHGVIDETKTDLQLVSSTKDCLRNRINRYDVRSRSNIAQE